MCPANYTSIHPPPARLELKPKELIRRWASPLGIKSGNRKKPSRAPLMDTEYNAHTEDTQWTCFSAGTGWNMEPLHSLLSLQKFSGELPVYSQNMFFLLSLCTSGVSSASSQASVSSASSTCGSCWTFLPGSRLHAMAELLELKGRNSAERKWSPNSEGKLKQQIANSFN